MEQSVAPASIPPLIELEGFSVGFQSKVVFRDISLEIPQCGVFGVMGPAGVGKSTLLRTIARWNDGYPSFWVRGALRCQGHDLGAMLTERAHRLVPLLAQKARLYTATVMENAIAQVRGDGMLSREQQEELSHQVLSPVGLWEEFRDVLWEPVLNLTIGRQRLLSIARLMGGDALCLLADEPLRDVTEDDAEAIAALIKRVGRHRAVVMVTHNQNRARQLFDHFCLVADTRVVETASAADFFAGPSTEAGRCFLATGNCWPRESSVVPTEPTELEPAKGLPTPPLQLSERATRKPAKAPSVLRPGAFRWILVDSLGGMQKPGLLQPEQQDLAALETLGCKVLMSLTEQEYDPTKLQPFGIRGVHFPILDMGVPDLEACQKVCHEISVWIDSGLRPVLHCRAGLGRTGTMLACVLVYRGETARRAIERVRSVNSLYIQSGEQLTFIGEFSSYLEAQGTEKGPGAVRLPPTVR